LATNWERALASVDEAAMCPPGAIEGFFDSFTVVDPGVPLIRLGGDGDGGYLVADDLTGIQACLSPGVDTVASFEKSLIDRGIPCHLVDASVAGPPFDHPLISFRPLFLGGHDGEGWITLNRWVSELPYDGDLLLQMDIEGHEWAALLATPRETLQRFRVIVLELHDLHLLATTLGRSVVTTAFQRLLDDFELVHVHPNNNLLPVDYRGLSLHPVVEVTWLRRDRIREASPVAALPHPLDQPCGPDLLEVPLDPRWP
jgi:hypothetical protein